MTTIGALLPAVLARLGTLWRIYVQRGLPEAVAERAVLKRLVEWHLQELGYCLDEQELWVRDVVQVLLAQATATRTPVKVAGQPGLRKARRRTARPRRRRAV